MKRSKKKQIYRMEQQDDLAISRKKYKKTINYNLFVFLKILGIILIPLFYFIYSPLLILCVGYYISLYFFAIMAERRMNVSLIKSNHIKIAKFDSALALIVIIIAFCGVAFSSTNKVKDSNFSNADSSQIYDYKHNNNMSGIRKNNIWKSIETTMTNLGTLLTGERSIFGEGSNNFGMGSPPEKFSDGNDTTSDREEMQLNIDDLPIEYLFSSSLSSVITILIFSISGIGVISLIVLQKKKNKFDNLMMEVLNDEVVLLTDAEIDKILMFGEEPSENENLDNDDADKKLENNINLNKNEKIINSLKDYEDSNEIVKNKSGDEESNQNSISNDINNNDTIQNETDIIKDDEILILDSNYKLDDDFNDKK